MDVQGAFLAKVILHQDLRRAVNARITLDHFTDERYQRVYGYLLKHWKEYGTSPGADVVAQAFPTMRWEDHSEPLDYFINALLQRRKRSLIIAGMDDAARLMGEENNPDAIDEMEAILRDALIQARLEANRTYDIDFTSEEYYEEVQRLLDEREADPGYLRGISTGFSGIDYVTGGLQPEHFVVLIGTPKSFKSSTALAIALNIHAQAKVPLFVGFEMSNVEQTDRSLSILSGVSLTKIMNGTVTVKERRRINLAHKMMRDKRAMFFSSDISSGMTVSGIQGKIQELDPDVVIIDGVYLMQSELPKVEPGSPQALTDISRNLKRLAQSSRIPILVTTQASLTRSRGGLHLGSAMYSQSWGQDSDIFMGVERMTQDGGHGEDEMVSGPVQVKFKVIESRSGPRKAVILEWDWTDGSVVELDPVRQAEKLDRRRVDNTYEDEI